MESNLSLVALMSGPGAMADEGGPGCVAVRAHRGCGEVQRRSDIAAECLVSFPSSRGAGPAPAQEVMTA